MSLQASMAPPGRQPMTLREQIAASNLAAIVGGQLAPGERRLEDRRAAALAVSRGPVRDGLRMLAKDSVVRIQPHRGTHAVQLSSQDPSNIFEIRFDLLGAMPHRSTRCDKALFAILDAELPGLRCSFHNVTRPAAGLAFALT